MVYGVHNNWILSNKLFVASLGGEVGIVHFVQSDADIQWLLSDKATHAPYIPVFSTEYFQG